MERENFFDKRDKFAKVNQRNDWGITEIMSGVRSTITFIQVKQMQSCYDFPLAK